MSIARPLVGLAALAALAVAINAAVLGTAVTEPAVYGSAAAGALLAAIWLGVHLVVRARGGAQRNLGTVRTVAASLVFVGICAVVYAFIQRPGWSWDLTEDRRHSLSGQTVQVLNSLTEDIGVSCFFVRTGDERVQTARERTEDFLERAAKHTPNLNVEFFDPQQSPERLKALDVLRVSEMGTVVLHAGTRTRVIPLSNLDARLDERTFTNALINVARDSSPKVYFLAGHEGRDINDTDPKHGGSHFRDWLRKEGYTVDELTVQLANPVIPEDATVLIINGYSVDLFDHEIRALDRFMDRGGRLMVLLNPQFGGPAVERLRPWLHRRFGVVIGDDILVSRTLNSYKIMATSDFSQFTGPASEPDISDNFRGSFNMMHPITRPIDRQFVFEFVRTVRFDDSVRKDLTGAELVRSTPDTWAEHDLEAVYDGDGIGRDADEAEGSMPMAAAVAERPTELPAAGEVRPESRVVVIGDADLSRNEVMNVTGVNALLLNSMAWLAEAEELIAIRPRAIEEQPVLLTPEEERTIAWLASLGGVQLIALAGLIAWIWRRRHA